MEIFPVSLLSSSQIDFLFSFNFFVCCRIFVDSDNEDDEAKFVDDEDDEVTSSNQQMADDDDDEEDELDKFMAGIEVGLQSSFDQIRLL